MHIINRLLNLILGGEYKPSNEILLKNINREYACNDWADYV
jgi:hypothetical protein